jgi:hypothetical protein
MVVYPEDAATVLEYTVLAADIAATAAGADPPSSTPVKVLGGKLVIPVVAVGVM